MQDGLIDHKPIFLTFQMEWIAIMEFALQTYLKKCETIFKVHQSTLSKVVPLPGKGEPTRDNRQLFETAIKEAENTEEFEALAKALEAGPLNSDLERLAREQEKQNDWKQRTAKQAARAFLRNTGTYVNLWQSKDIDESYLTATLNNSCHESELIRLFVFDGFVPYHREKRLNNVSLPVGEFKRYTENELNGTLGLPQSSWHWFISPEVVKKATMWNILTIKEKTEFRGLTGVWLNKERLICPVGWSEIIEMECTGRERDIEIIGPIFLCIGGEANLAVEIRVRTNIFEYYPIYQTVRNDYLPWEPVEEGEPQPRSSITDIGENGDKLRRIYEIWQRVNALDSRGYLRYPSEAYVRSVMNLHTPGEGLMETFVTLVTVIESLLTPGTRQELAYKMAMRGAALLASGFEHRMNLFQILDDHYKTRSKIVHEGHPDNDDPFELENMISDNLAEISRQIFLRYICLLCLGLDGGLPERILPKPEKLKSRENRPKTVAGILDSLVLNPELTDRLEKRMQDWGVYEDWIQKTGLYLFRKLN